MMFVWEDINNYDNTSILTTSAATSPRDGKFSNGNKSGAPAKWDVVHNSDSKFQNCGD